MPVRFKSVSVVLAEIIEYHFSMPILLSLVSLLLVSALMFLVILRRETTHRRRLAISEWARMNSMKLQRRPDAMPQPLDRLTGISATPETIISGERVQFVRFASIFNDDLLHWHAMIHQIESDWPATAVRPAEGWL